MAFLNLGGPSHCIPCENVRCKPGYTLVSNKMKETCASFLSLPSNSEVWHKRGHRAIVNAASATEAAVIATEPLTKEDLVGHHASGCKPKENWRIGTEHEKIGFEFETLRPMTYEQITVLLNGIAERFDWDRIMEGDNIIGLKQGMQSISLEAGGQFELSGAPLETLHQTCAEVNSHLYQVCQNCRRRNGNWILRNWFAAQMGPQRHTYNAQGGICSHISHGLKKLRNLDGVMEKIEFF
ncbi:unnamed protein product [Camellia sinensis]